MRGKILILISSVILTACMHNQGANSANDSAPPAESALDDNNSAIAHPALWPAAGSPDAITDAATEARIDHLLSQMTLEQKVGQLIQADISSITPADLKKYPLGSLLAGGNSGPYGNERSTAEDWNRMVSEYRAASITPAANGIAIPIIFGVDAVHGHNNIPSATIFPHNIGLGAAHDPDLIRRIGAATASEISGSGIEWTFAPTLAVPQDSRWGRTYEGYSSNPALVASYSGAMVYGLQGELVSGQPLQSGKVSATAKHFLADGGTLNGTDQGDAQISEIDLIRIHAAGYPPAIDAGALTVMASFSSWNGEKNHGNTSLLTDVLKGQMGFEGFVVGDWNGHGQVASCSVNSCPQAINAGLDMFMAPDSWKLLYENTLQQARDGVIPMERIDDAVRRILRVKIKLGLLDDPMQERANYQAIGSAEHLALAREAVAKSLVLLKNNGSVLPIKAGANVLVTGPGANDIAMQSGGWTISWQGTDVTAEDFPNGRTIWQGISQAVKNAGGIPVLSVNGAFETKPDVAIVIFGEHPYAEFQGDVPTLDYQPAGAKDLAVLKKLKAQGIPVVAVFLSGRPMFTSPEINASDAFVAAWLPGTQGDGIADVLVADRTGKSKRDFSGKLPFAWPSDARSPISDPLFPVGYGLSYAAPQNTAQLSEEPGIDLTKAMNVATYFAAGRAQEPWVLSVSDAGGKRPVKGAATVTPDGLLTVRSVDVTAQEDGKTFVWTGPASFSIEGPPANILQHYQDGYALTINWRIDRLGASDVKFAFGDTAFSAAPWMKNVQVGTIGSLAIPLDCISDNNALYENLGNALRLEADSGFAITLLSVQLTKSTHKVVCPN